jgi:hypothetical protein
MSMRGGLRQEDHDPEQLRKVLDAARRTDLASFIQAAFGIVNPNREYKHNYHIEAIAHRLEHKTAHHHRPTSEPKIALRLDRLPRIPART